MLRGCSNEIFFFVQTQRKAHGSKTIQLWNHLVFWDLL